MTSQTCIYGGDSCSLQPELFGGFCREHYRRLREHGSFECPGLATASSGAGCHLARETDPKRSSLAGRRNRHCPCCIRLPKQATAERAPSKAAGYKTPAESRNACPIGKSECGHQVCLYGGVCSKFYQLKSKWGCDQLKDPAREEPWHSASQTTGTMGKSRSVMHSLRGAQVRDPSASRGTWTCPKCGADMAAAGRDSECCRSSCSQVRRLGRI